MRVRDTMVAQHEYGSPGMDNVNSNGAPPGDGPVVRRFVVSTTGEPRWRRVLSTLRTRDHAQRRNQEVLLDSFDRRLQKAGLRLSACGESPQVLCQLRGPHEKRSDVVLADLPRFAWDFPRLQALELVRALEARPVEPIGLHETEGERWAVLDDQEKIVAWIGEERHFVHPPEGPHNGKPPIRRVELQGVRGYRTEFQRLTRVLERSGLTAATGGFDPLELVESAAPERGRWPRLDRRATALPALARIARAQIEVFAANEKGMRPGTDAEFLHDARVALRRLRSLLGQMKGVFSAAERTEVGEELRWLGGCLGPARDLDTLLLEIRLSEPELRADLAPALARLEQDRALRYAELGAALDSERHAKLRARLEVMLAAKASSAQAGRQAARPFVQVLSRRLRRRLEQVISNAKLTGEQHPYEDLHELRITCKKLRYLMECCRGFVPRATLAHCFADLKGLQGALGAIQDARVHTGLIAELAAALHEATPRVYLALGRFQEQTNLRARDARAGYAEAKRAFLSHSSQAEFGSLLRSLEGTQRP